MAKGDDSRARNRIDEQGGLAQNNLNNIRTGLVGQHQNFWNNYLSSTQRGVEDYNNLSGGFNQFAQTGGYSPEDISNIRARSIAPTRAMYSNAMRDVNRARSLQGGMSPGYGVLRSRMAREGSQALSDASTNAEAAIAQMVNQGKQFGLSGGAGLYSSTPGMANMFGNQVLQSGNQLLNTQSLQNELGLGLIRSQIGAAEIPGKWENFAGRVGQIGKFGRQILKPWGI